MAEGIEIRVYDPARHRRDWTGIIRPPRCAVFLRDAKTSTPCAVPLLWFEWANAFSTILPMLLGLTSIVAAVSILEWDLGARSQAAIRNERFVAYRRRARHV